MRVRRVVLLLGITLACQPAASDQRASMEQGRTYTDWLFGGQLDKLRARFSPEMQRTFPTVAELSSFVTRTTSELGKPSGTPTERMSLVGSTHVYSRVMQFDHASGPVEVQWTMGEDGRVTGLLIHPAMADSAAR